MPPAPLLALGPGPPEGPGSQSSAPLTGNLGGRQVGLGVSGHEETPVWGRRGLDGGGVVRSTRVWKGGSRPRQGLHSVLRRDGLSCISAPNSPPPCDPAQVVASACSPPAPSSASARSGLLAQASAPSSAPAPREPQSHPAPAPGPAWPSGSQTPRTVTGSCMEGRARACARTPSGEETSSA